MLVDYVFAAGSFDPRLSIVEGVHSLETVGVGGPALSVDVMPASRIAGASKSFVENVESRKPSGMTRQACSPLEPFAITCDTSMSLDQPVNKKSVGPDVVVDQKPVEWPVHAP